MGADDDVDFAVGQICEYLPDLFWRAGTREVVDPDGQVFETVFKCVVVLIGEDGRRHEDCDLLAVGRGLEGGADGDFGLAESYVAADEAVHRAVALHVGLDGLGSCQLVGRVLVDKRGLELLLEV